MNPTKPSTIATYINQFDFATQNQLNKIHQFIIATAPKNTTTTISYSIPTYKFNGTLIQFSVTKNYINIYAGAQTLAHFKDQVQAYKTTKNTIQVLLTSEFPYALLKNIIAYNSDLLKNKQGANWHKYQENWQEANTTMTQILEQLTLEKTFKWGTYVYTHNNKNVIAWGGFKNFFSVWFYQGAHLPDPLNVLIAAQQNKEYVLRQWRFTSAKQINAEQIKSYIANSILIINQAKAIKPLKTNNPILLNGYLKEQLDQNSELFEFFNKLTPGKQKEYIAYINEAKQLKTKESRYLKIIDLIKHGKGLNDKYKK